MHLSMQQWYQRYQQQASWTKSIRDILFQRAGLYNKKNNILDVGCGPGVILEELIQLSGQSIYGLDVDYHSLLFAKNTATNSYYSVGDAHFLPYRENSFDIVFCHFLLLWVMKPSRVISEMVRVTRPGGYVLAHAEPDYGGRIDFPRELEKIKDWQIESLTAQGANPLVGRELRFLFTNAELINVEVGVLGGQWKNSQPVSNFDLEWQVTTSDLRNNLDFLSAEPELHDVELASSEAQQRILFVPTFYAIGEVSK